MASDVSVDVLVVGGGLGGVSAALAAASLGVSVMLVESSNWLGGQLTAQGVCTPDEDALNGQAVVESYGATASYLDLKHRIREWYRTNTTLSSIGQAMPLLNIGRCWVNMGFAVEPAVAMQILTQMLSEMGVTPIFNATVSGPGVAGRLVTSLTVVESDGSSTVVTPKFVLDATETGDLLPLLQVPYVIGAEAANDTSEVGAPPVAHPEWVQPVTYPFAVIHRPAGENYTIDPPANYDQIKADQNFTLVDGAIKGMFTGGAPFWTYRRVIDRTLFNDARYGYDVATINVGANDYRGGIFPDDQNPGNNTAVLHSARQVSLAYLYWLQTEAPRDDGVNASGWPELMPAPHFFNTADGVSPAPYIRESRRILPITRVVQQNIDAQTNPGPRATLFADSCGIGNYVMDVHAGANGGPELQASTKPYQIPTGALIPQVCDNLLAAGKCLGVTHITNGAYRLHPQEWNVGESAGILAAFCIHNNNTPAQILAGPMLYQYQNQLLNRGIPLFWWSDVMTNPNWRHIQMVGVHGAFGGEDASLAFRPNDPFPDADKPIIEQRIGKAIQWPAGALTRSQATQVVASQMQWVQ